MTELLPTRQAADLRRAVIDYVTTAISLADPSVASALDAFLTDEDSGIFLGPYLRTRLPFAGGSDVAAARELVPSLPEWFEPYAHQAAAFSRLTTSPQAPGEQDEAGFRLPQPTIVTTGTGSGKTESFLYPVLDHAARARKAGIGGIKALILYPMNALANDQAGRLAKLLTDTPAYQGLSAALYTGEASHDPSTVVTADSLITDREMIRGSAPDVLLTNYKMLDQLLLRRADRPLWEASAASLRYLVLDEFHTYDGAQGTDVGMLLRRLRLVLDQIVPGRVHLTPVATSATLGDGADASTAMLDFARTVFGTDIGENAVITETRFDLDEFVRPSREAVVAAETGAAGEGTALRAQRLPSASSMAFAVGPHLEPGHPVDADQLTVDVLDVLWSADDATASTVAAQHGISTRDLLLAHPLVADLLRSTARATELRDLASTVFPWISDSSVAQDFTTALLAVLSHERARKEAPRNSFPNLEAHLWLREITRVDRIVSTAPTFTWSDALAEDDDRALPAIYCRHCGRSGWGVTTRAVGDDLDLRPDRIRKDSAEKTGRFRALILDVTTTDEDPDATTPETSRRRYLRLASESLDRLGPVEGDPDSDVFRVLVHAGLDADKHANDQTCPACGEKDGIRFLGTRLATLLSVALTSLFGTPGLDLQEKKALVFTDSVQDAAHRAGFVEARSYSLTMRSVIQHALTTEPAPITTLVERMLASATTDEQRYRLLHPTITDSDRLTAFWHQDPERRRGHRTRDMQRATARVAKRLTFDVGLELGLTGQVGRTLLLTGSALAHVRATDTELDQAAERALGTSTLQLDGDDVAVRRRWVRGILERLRTHGAIAHDWLTSFRRDGGPVYRLWGGRPEQDLMPAFPTGRALPQLPSIGRQGARSEFEDATSRSGWYADWSARVLARDRGTTSTFLRPLLDALTDQGVLDVEEATSGGLRSYALVPDRIEACLPAGTAEDGTPVLICDECRETVTGTSTVLAQLQDGPCLRHRCLGTLRTRELRATYYRSLYQGDMRRVVAREHTSLLTTEDRLRYETSFKNSEQAPGTPNVLVATPTLEMGIDIGDLSTVLLASVPKTVASYLQRVGRAGRQTGNALDVTFVAGRGRAAGLYYDPLDLLNGTVRAPGAYLSAQEILRRQLLASVLDTLAGDDRVQPPARTTPVLASAAPGTFLGHVIEEMTQNGEVHVDRFLARFTTGTHSWDGLTDQAREDLRAWALPQDDGGQSQLIASLHTAVARWTASREELRRRRARIQTNLEHLENQPLTDERAEAMAALRAEDLLISAEQDEIGAEPTLTAEEQEKERRRLRGRAGQLSAEVSALDSAHWIGVMERYGLLPNFTLVDDAVALEATVIWQDEDGTWKHDPVSYTRSGAAALTELAPGAHFYAHGRELVVDAVDIGIDGAALKPTAFCPRCGLAHPFEKSQPPQSCPNCHSAEIADAGQHRDVIDLTRVYSTMSRSRTRIGDSRDDREKVQFEQALSVSFHDAKQVQSWNVVGTGFGMRLDRDTTLTRLNLGRPHQVAEKIRISGEERTAPGFLLCAHCGHHDSDTAGNKPQDHQAWCDLRYAREGDNRAALLSRTLKTETVLITLPPEILDDAAGDLLVNLVAALRLGIQMRFGGSIGNLDVDLIAHPNEAGHTAVLLSDTIVGGTGYLFELASARSVWDVLLAGLRALETCPCQDEGLAACHRCLLPYVRPDAYESMRRTTAIEALHVLLGAEDPQPGAMQWTVEEREVELGAVSESSLERRFRNAYIHAMRSIDGADVTTRGSSISVRYDERTFTLESQVDIAGSRPDFVLTWPGSDVKGVAIFTDGREFHATAAKNRVADDAIKRMRLRRAGYLTLSITEADLTEDAARREDLDSDRAQGALPAFVDPVTVRQWADAGAQYRTLEPLLRATPFGLLTEIVTRGKVDRLNTLAAALPVLMVKGGDQSSLTTLGEVSAERIGTELLSGTRPAPFSDPTRLAVAKARDEVAAVGQPGPLRFSLTLVLDDRDEALRRGSSADSWRTWLQLANLAQGDPFGDTLRLTTVSLVEAGIDVTSDGAAAPRIPSAEEPTAQPTREQTEAPTTPTPTPLPADVVAVPELDDAEAGHLSPEWQDALDEAADEIERRLITLVSRYDIEPPIIGDEYGEGTPLEIAWPDRKVGVTAEELSPRERTALEQQGWAIVGPDPENVLAALELTGRGDQ
ncbi:DEAD/DEAH box helicase [Brachybacterium aquaticum]|uniref:ATP-dependent helicase YprA (DUF1998 family) n=1 Tax=Brachybacterium aquaticum TaxID=1432564 RepID=A0A841ACF2_9MICO|nr:DEAD/DEAH box helicase [Brachybacterium aquaticum]MBB5832516.1 ATP-dependent helicase YprA (DUF1998 family) [Brachybacterium aquaticum]